MRGMKLLAAIICGIPIAAALAGMTGGPSPAKGISPVIRHFNPNGVVSGRWISLGPAETVHLSVDQTRGCDGSARSWRRQDGVQIKLLWALCGRRQMGVLAKQYGIAQVEAPAEWHNASALGSDVDLVQLAPGHQVWRFWLQGNLDIAIATTCAHLQVLKCAGLAAPAARYLAGRLPGRPVVTSAKTLFPPASKLFGALVFLALVFVGCGRVSAKAKLERFRMSPRHPRLHDVDAIAMRLRSMSRRRWWGRFLVVLAALFLISTVAEAFHGLSIRVPVDIVLTFAAGAAAVWLLRRSSHPYLAREKYHQLRAGSAMLTIRRVAAAAVAILLGLLAFGAILAVGIGWLFAGLASASEDLSSILAGVLIAAITAGYFLDRVAQRLWARNVHDSMKRDDRPVLLYLRNFGDDKQKILTSRFSRRGLWQKSTAWLNPVPTARFEEVFTRALARSGPVIALAPAGSNLKKLVSAIAPTLGAAKTALPHDEWQKWVVSQAREAHAVVVSATPRQVNDGFAWELAMLARQVRHGRVILVFGPGRAADLHRAFGAFGSVACHFPLFSDLASGWITDGTLIMVHVPAEGWGTWHGWGAEQRTAWTYTAAIGEAMAYATTAWQRPPRVQTPLGGVELTGPVEMALANAAALANRDSRTIDTRSLLLALMAADGHGRWERILLDIGGREAIARAAYEDPPMLPEGQWRDLGLTGACTTALRTAARIARQYQMLPVPVGVVALGLIADPVSAAAQTLLIKDLDRQTAISTLIQDELIGVRLRDLRLVIAAVR